MNTMVEAWSVGGPDPAPSARPRKTKSDAFVAVLSNDPAPKPASATSPLKRQFAMSPDEFGLQRPPPPPADAAVGMASAPIETATTAPRRSKDGLMTVPYFQYVLLATGARARLHNGRRGAS